MLLPPIGRITKHDSQFHAALGNEKVRWRAASTGQPHDMARVEEGTAQAVSQSLPALSSMTSGPKLRVAPEGQHVMYKIYLLYVTRKPTGATQPGQSAQVTEQEVLVPDWSWP